MQVFIEQIINGLSVGAMFALVAAGLALTVGVLRVVNFAHGDLFMVGGYVFYFVYTAMGVHYLVAVVLTVLIMIIFGGIFERLVIRQVVERSWRVQLVATVAASTILNNGMIAVAGSLSKTASTDLSRSTVTILGSTMSWQRVLILGVTLLTFYGLHLFLTRTRTGKAMRAISQNRDAAFAAGIDINSISRITFLLAVGLVGLCSALVTPVYSVFPSMGMMLTMKAFAVLMVAGFGRVDTVIPAAFILGIAEALGTGIQGTTYTDAYAFIVMIAVLLLSPQGLFGKKVGI